MQNEPRNQGCVTRLPANDSSGGCPNCGTDAILRKAADKTSCSVIEQGILKHC